MIINQVISTSLYNTNICMCVWAYTYVCISICIYIHICNERLSVKADIKAKISIIFIKFIKSIYSLL